MNSKTEKLLKLMRFLEWIAFIGLFIKAGAIIMSFGVSVQNPEAATDLYQGMDLSRYAKASFAHYTIIVFYYILLYLLQAYIALFITKLLSAINIEKPFTQTVVDLLNKISYTILAVWILAIIHNAHVIGLEKYAEIIAAPFAWEYVFLAGIVYVLAQLFKRGIVMQTENELTV